MSRSFRTCIETRKLESHFEVEFQQNYGKTTAGKTNESTRTRRLEVSPTPRAGRELSAPRFDFFWSTLFLLLSYYFFRGPDPRFRNYFSLHTSFFVKAHLFFISTCASESLFVDRGPNDVIDRSPLHVATGRRNVNHFLRNINQICSCNESSDVSSGDLWCMWEKNCMRSASITYGDFCHNKPNERCLTLRSWN